MKVAGTLSPDWLPSELPVVVKTIKVEKSNPESEVRENSKLSWYSGPQTGRVASKLAAEKLPENTDTL